jgi:catechol 2,3-dioxygenase-like lactoylglutathione lyase family enzyme
VLGELSHITIWVDNFEEALTFYTSVLDLRVEYRDEHFAHLATEGTALYLHARTPGRRDWTTELRFQVEDIDRIVGILRAKGVEPVFGPVDQPWGVRIAGLRDPGGYIVEVAGPLAPDETN